jgi:CheY-like chemotaxis protein
MKANHPNKIVLLADDDPEDAEMFFLVLADVDASVKFDYVNNGLEIFEYLKLADNQKPDIIFLDINMPEMSGWQCLTALKSDEQTKDIPVLMYSTSSHPRDKQIAAELGASAFITKPSEYKTLLNILTAVTADLHNVKPNSSNPVS